jgi:uncharacterized membrane protein
MVEGAPVPIVEGVASSGAPDAALGAPAGGASVEPGGAPSVEPGAIIRRSAPRLVRDGFGPLAAFFAGWKLVGLTAGIALALAFGLAVFVHERRQGRPGALVRVALAVVCLRAIVGLSSGSASVYLAQEIAIDVLIASVILGTLAAGRPITAWIAEDVYPFTPEMRRSETYAAVMRRVTLVWGSYFLLRAAVRALALATLSTDSYVLVVALSDAPFLVALLAWSVHYTVTSFRRDPRWQAMFASGAATP